MAAHFGFIPSQAFILDINKAYTAHAGFPPEPYEPFYQVRERIIKNGLQELIDATILNCTNYMPKNFKTDLLIKLAQFIKSTVITLLPVVLTRQTDEECMYSFDFLNKCMFTKDDEVRFGMPLPESLVNQIFDACDNVILHQNYDIKALIKLLEQFAEILVDGYVKEFPETLGFGPIKLKTVAMARSTVSKMIKATISSFMNSVTGEELVALTIYYKSLFHKPTFTYAPAILPHIPEGIVV